MCGRFRLARSKQILKEHFGAAMEGDWEPCYNVAPAQPVVAVRQHATEPRRWAAALRWGLVPSWASDPSVGYKMINARAETVAERPAFGEALLRRRCLIAADGFYEWKKQGRAKLPYCFTLADGGVFAFAGLWDRWRSPEGQTVESCTILTTAANELVAPVHERMPVILPPDAYELWLDPGMQRAEAVREMLRPFAGPMRAYEVSTRVNAVQNDDAACAEPVERRPAGLPLFD